MSDPFDVTLDASGNLYVVDFSNNRVLYFPSGSASGVATPKVFGQQDLVSRISRAPPAA